MCKNESEIFISGKNHFPTKSSHTPSAQSSSVISVAQWWKFTQLPRKEATHLILGHVRKAPKIPFAIAPQLLILAYARSLATPVNVLALL